MHSRYFVYVLWHVMMSCCTEALDEHECRHLGHSSWLCDYMGVHGRNYSSIEELHLRKERLRAAKPYVDQGVTFGYTSRSDRFHNELRGNKALDDGEHRKVKRSAKKNHKSLGSARTYPPIDWRTHGRVTSVKDQGSCGGCFAFASAAVLEYWSGMYPKSLSAQSLMDCTSGNSLPDDGCGGGLMEYVFEYAMSHPVPLDRDFPYRERQLQCKKRLLWSHVGVRDYRVMAIETTPDAESRIEELIHKYGPVAVGIDSTTMDHYKSGIFRANRCTNDIEHAVAIVGYTKEFWIIKNSWSNLWGIDGYLYLERGKNACGVAEYIVYVTDGNPELKRETTYWRFMPT